MSASTFTVSPTVLLMGNCPPSTSGWTFSKTIRDPDCVIAGTLPEEASISPKCQDLLQADMPSPRGRHCNLVPALEDGVTPGDEHPGAAPNGHDQRIRGDGEGAEGTSHGGRVGGYGKMEKAHPVVDALCRLPPVDLVEDFRESRGIEVVEVPVHRLEQEVHLSGRHPGSLNVVEGQEDVSTVFAGLQEDPLPPFGISKVPIEGPVGVDQVLHTSTGFVPKVRRIVQLSQRLAGIISQTFLAEALQRKPQVGDPGVQQSLGQSPEPDEKTRVQTIFNNGKPLGIEPQYDHQGVSEHQPVEVGALMEGLAGLPSPVVRLFEEAEPYGDPLLKREPVELVSLVQEDRSVGANEGTVSEHPQEPCEEPDQIFARLPIHKGMRAKDLGNSVEASVLARV